MRTPWNKGKKMPQAMRDKMRKIMLAEWEAGEGRGFKKGNQLGKNTAGSNHGNWKGGFKIFTGRVSKYRWIRIGVGKYVAEHRFIMEKQLGRKLKKTEAIHHIDGNGLNNSIDNLQVVTWAEHKKIHSGSYIYEKFVCACGKTRHFAKGMCSTCYARERARKVYGWKRRYV